MGYSCHEYINGEKYCTLVINAGKCKARNALIKELAECISYYVYNEYAINYHTVNEGIYELISSERNCKLVVEKSGALREKNKALHESFLQDIKNYKAYAKGIGHRFIVEYP